MTGDSHATWGWGCLCAMRGIRYLLWTQRVQARRRQKENGNAGSGGVTQKVWIWSAALTWALVMFEQGSRINHCLLSAILTHLRSCSFRGNGNVRAWARVNALHHRKKENGRRAFNGRFLNNTVSVHCTAKHKPKHVTITKQAGSNRW